MAPNPGKDNNLVTNQTIGPVQEYWRDRIMSTINWGTTIWLIVIGWLVLNSEKFSVLSKSPPKVVSAVVMLIMVPFCGLVWSLILHIIYVKWLTCDVNDTVLPHKIVMSYAIGWTVVVTLITVGVAFF